MTQKRYELSYLPSAVLNAAFAPRLGTPREVYDDRGELVGYVAQHTEPRGSWYEMYDIAYNSFGEATGNSRLSAERQLRNLIGRSAKPTRLHARLKS